MSTAAVDTRLKRTWGLYEVYIGKKLVMAGTGVILVLYVIGHMLGNLQIFAGPEQMNRYAAFLHSQPGLLWTARIVLVAAVVAHIWSSFLLWLEKRARAPRRLREEKQRAGIVRLAHDDVERPDRGGLRHLSCAAPHAGCGLRLSGAHTRRRRRNLLCLPERGERVPAPGGFGRLHRRDRAATHAPVPRALEHVPVARDEPPTLHAAAEKALAHVLSIAIAMGNISIPHRT